MRKAIERFHLPSSDKLFYDEYYENEIRNIVSFPLYGNDQTINNFYAVVV